MHQLNLLHRLSRQLTRPAGVWQQQCAAFARCQQSHCKDRYCYPQVNVHLPTVTAFGIRLNDDLAAMADRISGIPAGQLSSSGPAYIWNITSTGPQQYIFQVNTTGLTSGTGPQAAPDLSDICAQGIQIADDEGNLLWQQPTTASTCV